MSRPTFTGLVALHYSWELVQPLILVLAGAIPFFEGEGSAALGVFSGVHPVVVALAAITGNVLCVAAVVWLGSWVRESVVARRRRSGAGQGPVPASDEVGESKPENKGQRRLKRWLVRFGVPGASLLAPLALPTMFTAATLVGTGVAKRWVMLWQVVAIVLWTTAVTVAAAGVLSVVGG